MGIETGQPGVAQQSGGGIPTHLRTAHPVQLQQTAVKDPVKMEIPVTYTYEEGPVVRPKLGAGAAKAYLPDSEYEEDLDSNPERKQHRRFLEEVDHLAPAGRYARRNLGHQGAAKLPQQPGQYGNVLPADMQAAQMQGQVTSVNLPSPSPPRHQQDPHRDDDGDQRAHRPYHALAEERRRHHPRRREGPPHNKLSTYDGSKDWNPFEMQFERSGRLYGWDDADMLDRLIEALRDKALKFFAEQTATVRSDYFEIRSKMRQRFGAKDDPMTVRRQLQDLRQGEKETLEEYAERAYELAVGGYPGALDATLETIATEAFLKGCSEKRAALSAMDRQPTTLDQARQLVKNAISNQRVLLGDGKVKVRQVHFEDFEEAEPKVREVKADRDVNKRMDALEKKVSQLAEKVEQALQQLTSSRRPPTPPGSPRQNMRCYSCNNPGHLARECPSPKKGSLDATAPKEKSEN